MHPGSVCAFLCVCMSICTGAYVEVRGQPCMLFLKCYHFGGGVGPGLSMSWNSPIRPGWMTSKSQGPACLRSPIAGSTSTRHILQFCFLTWGLNSGSRVSRQTLCSLRWMRIRSLLLDDSRVANPSQWLLLARGHSVGLKLVDTGLCLSITVNPHVDSEASTL